MELLASAHGKLSLLDNGSGLLVNLFGPEDAGNYSCRAGNLAGALDRWVQVEITRRGLWDHSPTAQTLAGVICVVAALVLALLAILIYCCRRHQVGELTQTRMRG